MLGSAEIAFENLENQNENTRITWREATSKLLEFFLLNEIWEVSFAKLPTRVQLSNESLTQYFTAMQRFCAQCNILDKERICSHILKGLNLGTQQKVSLMGNSTLQKLKHNISKFEMSIYLMRQRLGIQNTGRGF